MTAIAEELGLTEEQQAGTWSVAQTRTVIVLYTQHRWPIKTRTQYFITINHIPLKSGFLYHVIIFSQ